MDIDGGSKITVSPKEFRTPLPADYSNPTTQNNLSSPSLASAETRSQHSAMNINIPGDGGASNSSSDSEGFLGDVEDEGKPAIILRGQPAVPAAKGLTVFTAAVFIIGEMAGSGVLALPAAIVDSGWTGIALLLLACLVSGYCGSILGQSWSILRERHPEYRGHVRYPYPAIGQKAVGNWGARAVTVCVNATLLGRYLFTSLKPSYYFSCYVVSKSFFNAKNQADRLCNHTTASAIPNTNS